VISYETRDPFFFESLRCASPSIFAARPRIPQSPRGSSSNGWKPVTMVIFTPQIAHFGKPVRLWPLNLRARSV